MTSRVDSTRLAALVLDRYNRFIEFGYPKDPNVYIIKAHPTMVKYLRMAGEYIQFTLKEIKVEREGRFMGFRVEEDPCLDPNTLVFGPESEIITWSK